MATQKKPDNPRQKYKVLQPYQCPNRKCWHQPKETVELLPCEAYFLLLSGKVELIPVSVSKQKGERNA